jgi:two-component system, LuxR family, sensor kinase FixL
MTRTKNESVITRQNGLDADAKLNALLNAAVDAIVVIDHRGRLEVFNAAAELMFGYQAAEIIGKNVKVLMPEPYHSEHDGYINNYVQSKKAKIIGIGREVKAQKKSGEIFPIELSVGEVLGSSHKQFVGIMRDITERVQTQNDAMEIRERLAHVSRLSTMGEMAAGIAHEVNQPLAAVTTYAQACQRLIANSTKEDTSKLHEKLNIALDKIGAQALRAGEVIKRLRSFVKKRPASRETIDLNVLIQDTVNLAKVDTRLFDHGVTLELTDQPQLTVDAVQLQQVLLNLIRNAIDAMQNQQGNPVVIRTNWFDEDFIEVSVIDSGQGVTPEHKTSLFEPFFTTKETGMGMGLPISQSIIKSHGGQLWHSDNTPQGSIFHFTLPAQISMAQYT